MKQVFVDTSYWIALLNPRDHLHARVLDVSRGLPQVRLITSEMVLGELLNGLSEFGPLRMAAAEAAEAIRTDASLTLVAQTTEQFQGALKLYQKSTDKNWSLTDCASFLIMGERGITTALTHDRHFIQAGFEALLR